MRLSDHARRKKIAKYKYLAEEYEEGSPDWHYWMQYIESLK